MILGTTNIVINIHTVYTISRPLFGIPPFLVDIFVLYLSP